jgi:hypothetical protein
MLRHLGLNETVLRLAFQQPAHERMTCGGS